MYRNTPPPIRPKQSLGQNFLIDDNIARNVIRNLQLLKNEIVLEIGAGRGALTKHLVGHVRHLIIVEIDDRVIDDLNKRFASDRVTVLHQDFLDTDLSSWYQRYRRKLRIVGNIPYHLTSPILFKVFDASPMIKDITIMMQREVARRIVATPGTKEYGILTVFSQFHGVPKILFNVSPNCFYPKPKVTSAILQIRLHTRSLFRVNDEIFRRVVRTTFGKRRKALRNSLKDLWFNRTNVEDIIEQIDFPLEKRPEQLTIEQFADLARQVEPYIQY